MTGIVRVVVASVGITGKQPEASANEDWILLAKPTAPWLCSSGGREGTPLMLSSSSQGGQH